jgi:hypothetical protein
MPVSRDSSSTLGVIQPTAATRCSRSSAAPSASSSAVPELEQSTGSRTVRGRSSGRARRKRSTSAAAAEVASMPIFTAAIGMSAASSLSVSRSRVAETGSTRRTAAVDCTVRAVMAATP